MASTPTASVARLGVRSPSAVAEISEKEGVFCCHFAGSAGHFGFQPKNMNASVPARKLIAAFLTIDIEALYSSLTRPGHAFFDTKPAARAATFSATVSGGIGSSAL